MTSASFDDVAAAAASGAAPIVIAVAKDLATLDSLCRWLETAVPAFGKRAVKRVISDELPEGQTDENRGGPAVVVIADAASGDDEALRARWSKWNSIRERLLTAVDYGRSGSFVFLVTSSRMSEVSAVSPHLLSVATVLTVEEDAEEAKLDEEMQAAYREVLHDLEQRYRLSTRELIERLLARKDVPVTGHDLARWQAAAEALQAADS